jgi:hypothetical protein
MSLIGKKVIHRKYGDEGIIKNLEIIHSNFNFEILLTIEFEIDYDLLTYKTLYNEVRIV